MLEFILGSPYSRKLPFGLEYCGTYIPIFFTAQKNHSEKCSNPLLASGIFGQPKTFSARINHIPYLHPRFSGFRV